MKSTAVAIDLFAGGGGLSLGLKTAGFVVSAAVEIEDAAADTYEANHPGTVLFRRDIREVSAIELIRTSPTGKIDLIAACPPCQGFSSLTSKYKRVDSRNELIFEFVRLAVKIKPAMIMMENVPGLAKKGAPIFDDAMRKLRSAGYKIRYKIVDVADFGVPQRRKRLVVFGSLQHEVEIPMRTHSAKPTESTLPWATVRDAISERPKPVTLEKAMASGGPSVHDWHVVRSMSDTTLERLRATKPGRPRSELPKSLRPACHRSSNIGFTNVYGRMAWDQPAPTITGGCTTLSKGRFGHPALLRTISLREAALLQSFPPSYKFKTDHMEKVCNIVGNALPPRFAHAMAIACLEQVMNQRKE